MRALLSLLPAFLLLGACGCVTPAAPEKVIGCDAVLEQWVKANGQPAIAEGMPDGGVVLGVADLSGETRLLIVVSEGQLSKLDTELASNETIEVTEKSHCEHPQSKYVYKVRKIVKKVPGQPV